MKEFKEHIASEVVSITKTVVTNLSKLEQYFYDQENVLYMQLQCNWLASPCRYRTPWSRKVPVLGQNDNGTLGYLSGEKKKFLEE